MDTLLLFLFVGSVYSLIVIFSKKSLIKWCRALFTARTEVTEAAGILAATFWPIGWPMILIIGAFQVANRVVRELYRCVMVIVNHIQQQVGKA